MSLLDPGYFEKNNSKQEYRQAQEQILCVRKQFINNAIKENYLFYPSTTRFLPSFFARYRAVSARWIRVSGVSLACI